MRAIIISTRSKVSRSNVWFNFLSGSSGIVKEMNRLGAHSISMSYYWRIRLCPRPSNTQNSWKTLTTLESWERRSGTFLGSEDISWEFRICSWCPFLEIKICRTFNIMNKDFGKLIDFDQGLGPKIECLHTTTTKIWTVWSKLMEEVIKSLNEMLLINYVVLEHPLIDVWRWI